MMNVCRQSLWSSRKGRDEKMKNVMKKSFFLILCLGVILATVACGKNDNEEDDMNDINITETKKEEARVILLAGQSNASGISYIEFLKDKVTEEKFTEYSNGYENIQICYYVDNQNISTEFVPVALGQGHMESNFGPEIGIAEYLTETYPGEKFYIIKTTMSGSGIAAEWQETDETYNKMITGIDNAFLKLEKNGLEPKWFATCWMQGEGDSWNPEHAQNYYNLETDLMNRLQTRFAKYASEKGVSLIDAGISQNPEWKYSDLVNAAKKQYADENERNFYIDTQAAGLTYNQDNEDYAHYDAESMITLGRMFGEKLAILSK